MKAGIIRCAQTEDYCPGTTDFLVMREKKRAFSGVKGDIDIIGFVTCGGCPGKKALLRAREMVKRGADTIVFASCITRGNPLGFPCPFAKELIKSVRDGLGGEILVLDYTH